MMEVFLYQSMRMLQDVLGIYNCIDPEVSFK